MDKQPIGNEDAMAEMRRTIEAHKQTQAGAELKEGEFIDFTSSEGTPYKGTVVFRKPSMGDFMRMGAIKSEILRAAGVVDLTLLDKNVDFMAHVMSTLEIVLFKRPEWLLKLEHINESDVLYHVYGRYLKWADSFRKPVPVATTEDSETTAGA